MNTCLFNSWLDVAKLHTRLVVWKNADTKSGLWDMAQIQDFQIYQCGLKENPINTGLIVFVIMRPRYDYEKASAN